MLILAFLLEYILGTIGNVAIDLNWNLGKFYVRRVKDVK